MHYLLFYDVVENYVEKRAPFRSAHIALAREAHAAGDLVLAGALANPADGAVFFFQETVPTPPQNSPMPIPTCRTASSRIGGSGSGPR